MNQLVRDMRPELCGPKVQKIRVWIDDVDVKVKKRLEERVKIIPTIVQGARSLTPQKQSTITSIQPSKEAQIKQRATLGSFEAGDEENVILLNHSDDDDDNRSSGEAKKLEQTRSIQA